MHLLMDGTNNNDEVLRIMAYLFSGLRHRSQSVHYQFSGLHYQFQVCVTYFQGCVTNPKAFITHSLFHNHNQLSGLTKIQNCPPQGCKDREKHVWEVFLPKPPSHTI